ncbi:MAG TPA: serine--tRNA ligase [Candidatus Dormibacteraeota bacterium]|nr:serine--tRNA ligase [Candidatus Dormibacteraeota bacterium]
MAVLDLKLIRRDPEGVKAALARRGGDFAATVDEVLEADERWRLLTTRAEELKAEQNAAGKQIGELKRAGQDASEAMQRSTELKEQVGPAEDAAREAKAELDAKLVTLPNLTDESSPVEEEEIIREVGQAGKTGKDHLELLGELVDMERAARVSGSRFVYLKGPVVMLEFALVRWALEKLQGHGFTPVIPPVLVREEAMYGTGFLPDTEQQLYHLPDDDLYLVGTSEVPLASMHAGEILEDESLPLRYAGFSTCFRREAGAAGKDTRGMFRVHQFDKVEMFTFVRPSESADEHERILAIEEELLQDLEIPYRVANIPAWDLGASAAKKYDLEGWLPGQERYRELTSCSNTTDFQARRLGIRYRPAGGRPEEVHTLNGTAVAVGRTIIAIVENHQQDDGSIRIPEALHPYGAPPLIEAAN